MFNEAYPGKMVNGLHRSQQDVHEACKKRVNPRDVGLAIRNMALLDREDHDRYRVSGLCLEDAMKQPLAVDLGAAPVLVTLLDRDVFRHIPEGSISIGS